MQAIARICKLGCFVGDGVWVVLAEVATEIEAAGHMLCANHVRDVGGMVCQAIDGSVLGVNEAAPGVHADDAAPLRDGADLIVLQVALGGAERPGVGVGGNEGLFRVGDDIPEGLFTGVGNVDKHAETFHDMQRLYAARGNAVAGTFMR